MAHDSRRAAPVGAAAWPCRERPPGGGRCGAARAFVGTTSVVRRAAVRLKPPLRTCSGRAPRRAARARPMAPVSARISSSDAAGSRDGWWSARPHPRARLARCRPTDPGAEARQDRWRGTRRARAAAGATAATAWGVGVGVGVSVVATCATAWGWAGSPSASARADGGTIAAGEAASAGGRRCGRRRGARRR